MDFVSIETKVTRSGSIEVYPKFLVKRSKDLMIRGHDFYAIWDESAKRWSTDKQTVIDSIDYLISEKVAELQKAGQPAHPMYMVDSDSKSVDKCNHYCQRDRTKRINNDAAKGTTTSASFFFSSAMKSGKVRTFSCIARDTRNSARSLSLMPR